MIYILDGELESANPLKGFLDARPYTNFKNVLPLPGILILNQLGMFNEELFLSPYLILFIQMEGSKKNFFPLIFLFFLFRFWETDIRTVRKTNRSTIRRKNTMKGGISS